MILISTWTICPARFTRLLAAALVAVGVTACTVDKNLATASDGDTDAATTIVNPTTGMSTGDTSTGTSTGDTPTGTNDTTDTTGTTTGDTDTGGGFPDELAEGCGFKRPCADVRLNCGDDSWSEDCTADYSKETQCALDQLAAGEAFALRFDLNNGEVEWFDLVFDGEGGAVRQHWLEDPGNLESAPVGPPEACTLISVDMFQNCITVPNDDSLHGQCMLLDNWFTGCEADPALMCPTT